MSSRYRFNVVQRRRLEVLAWHVHVDKCLRVPKVQMQAPHDGSLHVLGGQGTYTRHSTCIN